MGVVYDLLKDYKIPRMVKIHQKFDTDHIAPEDIPSVIRAKLERPEIAEKFKPGMEIAITVGSRGISNTALVVKSTADWLKERGCTPFVVPAMGSHGNATAEGQERVVRDYGCVPEYTGCEIRSSMETVYIGDTETGRPVYFDKNAYNADGVIVLNRIKAHTDFRGPYESGLMKMLTIGLGKQYGAQCAHADGFGEMHKYVPEYGKAMLKHAPIACGIGLTENAYEETRTIDILTPQEIIDLEPGILAESKKYMARILWDSCDILIVDEMGKNYSGAGMDPNVTGRFQVPYASGGIECKRLMVLDLSEESHGNACGVGMADVTTRRLYDKFDMEATYPNCITNTVVEGMRIPVVMESDKLALQCCIRTAVQIDNDAPRIIRIPDTLHLSDIWISEALLPEALANPNIDVLGEPEEMVFDENGNLF
ncbi:MAG: DUF2088 domain-containing protein [Eubacterium sp.]|nr:DUF2088 domain-containing protein [Eubacterium sp.]